MKNLFVVGGSSGIGEAAVKKFLSEGYCAVNLSRSMCKVEGVENVLCDVTERESLEKALEDYCKKTKEVDVFLYSAGFSMASPLEYVLDADVRYLYEVNFFGFLTCLKKLLPILRRAQGTVCVIGSVGGVQPIAYDSFYSSSKAAVNMLIFALQAELLPMGVKAIAILPGGTSTRFTFKRKIYPYDSVGDYADDMLEATKRLHDIEQNGMTPEAVAETIYKKCVTQCCSNIFASGFVNKAMIFSTRFMPQSLNNYLIKKIYFE